MASEIAYTLPITEIQCTGLYPDIPEFREPEKYCVAVGQGFGGISREGMPLQSEGFSSCSALIIKDRVTLESALFHIEHPDHIGNLHPTIEEFMTDYISRVEVDPKERERLLSATRYIAQNKGPSVYEGMSRQDFQARMQQLNGSGDLTGQFIFGTASMYKRDSVIESMLEYFGVQVMDNILADTGRRPFALFWDVVYKPKDSEVLVYSREHMKIFSYSF